ncbi:hypothetical protein GQ457_17G013620 [Hibiscus cannabinus]
MVTEALHLMLDAAENFGLIRGITNVFPSQSISHLQFADDIVIFLKPEEKCLVNVKCGCKVGELHFYYLGIPLGEDPRRVKIWESIVDRLKLKLLEFIAAAATLLETKESSAAQKAAATGAALENFKQQWELFNVACDPEEFVESTKQRIGSECLVDEATGSMAGGSQGSSRPAFLP